MAETRMRFRAGVGFDADDDGWIVAIEIWLEPDMTADDAIKFFLPTLYPSQDAALCAYMDDVRPNLIKPILERAKASGLTLEILKTTADEIVKALADRTPTNTN